MTQTQSQGNLNTPTRPPKVPLNTGLLLILSLPPLFWAGNVIVGRAMKGVIPPVTLSFLRWVIALAVLLPFAIHAIQHDWRLYWQYRWRILFISVVGVTAFNTLVYFGLQNTSATNGILLNSFIPILIVLLGWLSYGYRLQLRQLVGMLISFLGVLTIILHGDWHRLLKLEFGQGNMVIFVAVVCWAIYTLQLRNIPAQINRTGLLAVQMAISIIVLLPLVLLERHAGLYPQWSYASIAALAYIGIFPSVLAYLFYNWGVDKAGPARTGLFIHLMPFFGVILSALILGEYPQPYQLIGLAAILIGIAISSRG